ncbi:hypothetical protein [Leptolyngbya sp. FACHB-261]|uniref:hypothetical protein n=1 Tax=Leptolyngbya sp. FACHB-261 TaxID=2692806 RepID=UPI0016832F1B|nr:hypothetical protein [Leptolyngbya sp. FACHB-261]MBD2101434.1 hypothetical protein [Leptolyngbya sp. FACHB-261]
MYWDFARRIKKSLGCTGITTFKLGEQWTFYHDLYHVEVACLERIQIGPHQVSGIHGINATAFHDAPLVEEYEAYFDEARVAVHEWFTRPSIFTTLKLIHWLVWFALRGINSFAVLIRHWRSLQRAPQGFQVTAREILLKRLQAQNLDKHRESEGN